MITDLNSNKIALDFNVNFSNAVKVDHTIREGYHVIGMKLANKTSWLDGGDNL